MLKCEQKKVPEFVYSPLEVPRNIRLGATLGSRHYWSAWLLSFSIGLLWFGVLSGITYLWVDGNTKLFPSGKYVLIPCLIAFCTALMLNDLKLRSLKIIPEGFAAVIVVLYFSDWLCRPYNLFQGPAIRGELFLFGAITYLLLRRQLHSLFILLPLVSIALLFYCFFITSNGQTIFSDDHATFFYRLALLKEQFPQIPFYNPLWNAGIDQRDFFATGVLNLFLLYSPLIYLFPLESIYNFIVSSLLFLVFPSFVFWAARREGLRYTGSSIAAALTLIVSLHWYRWALKYGTMGFVTSCVLIPINLSLVAQVFSKDRPLRWYEALFMIASCSLMLCWSGSGLAFIPLILLGVTQLRSLLRRPHVLKVVIGLVLINLPWIMLFWSVSSVSTFLVSEKATEQILAPEQTQEQILTVEDDENALEVNRYKHEESLPTIQAALASLRGFAHSTNPLILLLAIPGIFLLRPSSRMCFGITAIWLLLLGTVAVPLKPQLELDRMLLVLAVISTVPVAFAIEHLFDQASRRGANLVLKVPAALVGGFLLTGPWISGSLLKNRTVEHYYFDDGTVEAYKKFLQDRKSSGRIMFSGCVIHQFNHGHLAPLALNSPHPLIASSHVHNLWWYKDVIPNEFLKRGDTGKREFMDLNNVTGVFAHEPKQRAFFKKRPEEFTLTWHHESFHFYERNVRSNYFLEGQGEILAQKNAEVRLRVDSENAVIKFNYFPFVEASACTISPEPVSKSLTFIRLSQCPIGAEVLLKAGNPLRRLW